MVPAFASTVVAPPGRTRATTACQKYPTPPCSYQTNQSLNCVRIRRKQPPVIGCAATGKGAIYLVITRCAGNCATDAPKSVGPAIDLRHRLDREVRSVAIRGRVSA